MKKNLLIFGFLILVVAFVVFPLQVNCLANNQPARTFSATPMSPAFYDLPSGANFSVVWITDTQYLSESYPTYFTSLCRWIVNNAEKYKIKIVIHTGDLVEDEFNRTHWENANASMGLLLDSNIPYCWNAGNHDYNETCWIGNQYTAFNPDVLAGRPYWIDDKLDGQNTAVKFSIDDWDFMVVNIAYEASDEVLDWANNLLDSYPDSHTIVGAHVYLNRTGGYAGKGRDDANWPIHFKDEVLDTHGNVFLTLSAHHYPCSGTRTQVGGRHELMFNWQDADSQMGAASLRLMSFDLARGKIEVQTLVLYANSFLEDPNNQFVLTTNFYNKLLPEKESEESFLLPIIVVSGVIILVLLFLSYKLIRKR